MYSHLYLDSLLLIRRLTETLQQHIHLAALCQTLELCPPIACKLESRPLLQGWLHFNLDDSQDSNCQYCVAPVAATRRFTHDTLAASELVTLFGLPASLKRLHLAGFHWQTFYSAVNSCASMHTLKELHLRYMLSPPLSILPVSLVQSSGSFLSLRTLYVEDLDPVWECDEQGPSSELGDGAPAAPLARTARNCRKQPLETLTIRTFTIDGFRRELATLDHHLSSLSLTLTVQQAATLAEFAPTLVCNLNHLNLRFSQRPSRTAAWCDSIEKTLKSATALRSFVLSCSRALRAQSLQALLSP